MYGGDKNFEALKDIGDNAIVRCCELLSKNGKEYYPNEDVYENVLYEAFKKCESRIRDRFSNLNINTASLNTFPPTMVAAYISKEIILQKPIERVERIYSLPWGEKVVFAKTLRENYIFALLFSFDIIVQSQIFRYAKSEEDKQAIMDELVGQDSPSRIYSDEMIETIVSYIIKLRKKVSEDNFLFVLALAEIYDIVYNIFHAPVMRKMVLLHINK